MRDGLKRWLDENAGRHMTLSDELLADLAEPDEEEESMSKYDRDEMHERRPAVSGAEGEGA